MKQFSLILFLFVTISCHQKVTKEHVINEANREVSYFLEKYNLSGSDFVYEIDTASIAWPIKEKILTDKKATVDVRIKFPKKSEYAMIYCYSQQYEGGVVFLAYLSEPLLEVINRRTINEEAVGNWDWIILKEMSEYE